MTYYELPNPDWPELSELWKSRWPDCPPIGHELKHQLPNWIRFHSLPDSQRYHTNEAEYQILLDRHRAILGELFGGGPLLVVTASFVTDGCENLDPIDPHSLNPGSRAWMRLRDNDPDGGCTMLLQVGEQTATAAALDPLLRAVADNQIAEVILADPHFRRLFHPYDGGCDVIAESATERERLKQKFAAWLSPHASGL